MVACIVNLASRHLGDNYKVTSCNPDYSIPDSIESRVQVQLQAASITATTHCISGEVRVRLRQQIQWRTVKGCYKTWIEIIHNWNLIMESRLFKKYSAELKKPLSCIDFNWTILREWLLSKQHST